MRIAISATGPTLDADVDPRFGRITGGRRTLCPPDCKYPQGSN
jgi:hypothetical protein